MKTFTQPLTELEIKKEAAQLASDLKQAKQYKTCILLWGDVGVGKSVFARAFIRAYYGKPDLYVPSPTFTIVQTYSVSTLPPSNDLADIWHFDLYRVGHPEEFQEIGLYEAMGRDLCLIEWPEVLINQSVCPESLKQFPCMHVQLDIADEETRYMTLRFGTLEQSEKSKTFR